MSKKQINKITIQKYKKIKKSTKKAWQRVILAGSRPTTFTATVLNFCVRDGNRCVHSAIVTRLFLSG